MNFESLEYTLVLIAWVIVIAMGFQIAAFFSFDRREYFSFFKFLKFPSVLLAPFVIVFGYKIFHWNFVAGIKSDMSLFDIIRTTFIPGCVLVFASGLASSIFLTTEQNEATWRKLGFIKFARANGKEVWRQTFHLTTVKSLSESLLFCGPTIFAELVVVEALFNCYGLGYQVLSSLREEKFFEAALSFMIIVGLSLVSLLTAWFLSKRLGEKLESYS